VSFAQITKQLAQQAVGDSVKEAIDALRPADAAAVADSISAQRQAAPPVTDNLAATIAGQVQAMQNALKDDQELIVLCSTGMEMLRILEFFTPTPLLLVLTGIDSAKTITRIVCPAESLQLVCKPMTAPAGAKPARIRFVSPKPKAE
jgi:hypothetical protein